MTTISKLESKGYSIVSNISWYNGRQRIAAVTAKKDNRIIATADNVTQLYNILRSYNWPSYSL